MTEHLLPEAPFPTPPGVVYRSGRNRGICPRCHVFIVPTSRVVRLHRSEHPNATPDLTRSADTGKLYFSDAREVSLRSKWFVHERCFRKHYGEPRLPLEVERRFRDTLFVCETRDAEADQRAADALALAPAQAIRQVDTEAAKYVARTRPELTGLALLREAVTLRSTVWGVE